MHVIVGEAGVLLNFDAERLQSAERSIGVVAKRLEQLVLPLGEAQEGIAAVKEERSSHTRHIDKGVSLAIDYTGPLHEPIIRNPHPGDRFASGPADLRRLLK